MIQLNPTSEDVHHGSASSTIGIQTESEDFGVTSMLGGPPGLTTPTSSSAMVSSWTMEAARPSTTLSPSSTPPPELLEHPQSPTLQIEPEFFWDSVQFEVQGHLVKLPVNIFVQNSDKFLEECGGIDIGAKDRFSWSVSQATGQHGSDIPCIKLEGVEWEDFKSFLKALVPKSPFIESKPTLTKSEWISVLKLSTRWYFNDLRKVAIDELSEVEMDPIQRVCLAKAYHVYDWLLEGYEELVEREDPITEEEGEKIGMGVALKLCGIALRRVRGESHGLLWARLSDECTTTTITATWRPFK
ncbi:hypothetical protein CC2G_014539 [Coprinopsis cinerea AmutBmut pab1-1]|nr:hypothetical protein CC2G_014539 [Coprinopsis cinerea AmutBmut pab1-1]